MRGICWGITQDDTRLRCLSHLRPIDIWGSVLRICSRFIASCSEIQSTRQFARSRHDALWDKVISLLLLLLLGHLIVLLLRLPLPPSSSSSMATMVMSTSSSAVLWRILVVVVVRVALKVLASSAATLCKRMKRYSCN